MSARALESTASPRAVPPTLRTPCVWAVGGGKGGVGKSVVAANLAIAFAQRGERVALVDADFGGANLHTVLGMRAPERSLAHFLSCDVRQLADVLTPTPVPRLSLISGARCSLEAANLPHGQKLRLVRQLRSLPVDHVFVDLSAGSTYNALDLFLEADRALLVVVPEPTSIENAYHFLKAAFFRSLRRAVRRSRCPGAIQAALEAKSRQRIRSARELVAHLAELDPEVGDALDESLAAFRPQVLVNQARRPEHRALASRIADTTQGYLGSQVTALGTLPRDESVVDALSRGLAVSRLRPGCPFVLALEQVAERLRDAAAPVSRECERAAHRLSGSLYDPSYFASHGELPPELPRHPPEAARNGRPRPSGAAPGIAEPGAHLRYCREFLGLSLPDLCHHTRIRQLEQIEAERFDELPPESYTRGFVLQYAQALGIPESQALANRFTARLREARAGTAGDRATQPLAK